MRQWHFCNTNATGQNDVVLNTCSGTRSLDLGSGKHKFEQGKGNCGSNGIFSRKKTTRTSSFFIIHHQILQNMKITKSQPKSTNL